MEKERHESDVDRKRNMWHKGPKPKGIQDQRAVLSIMPSRCPPTSRICSAVFALKAKILKTFEISSISSYCFVLVLHAEEMVIKLIEF